MSLIAVDYDDTITTDPEIWGIIMAMLRARGHKIIVCTLRFKHEPVYKVISDVTVYYTGRHAKKQFLENLGVRPDIWIDDNPQYILANHASCKPEKESKNG